MASEKNLVEQGIADDVVQDQAEKGSANGYMGLDGSSRGAQNPKLHKSGHIEGGADAFDENDAIRAGTLKTGLTTERYTKNATTADATPIDLDDIAVAEGEVIDVEANVMARKADGSERAIYHLEALFYRNASGNVTREGNTASLFTRRSTPSISVELEPDTGNQTADIRITGLAATVKWEARVIVTRLKS